MRVDQPFLYAVPLDVGRLFIVLFLLAELDCQSKLFFSSVAVFHFATERGRCLKCSPKKTCLLQIIVQKWSKTGRNVSSKGFKALYSGFLPSLCYFLLPFSMFAVHFNCHSASIFLCMPFDYIRVYTCGQSVFVL